MTIIATDIGFAEAPRWHKGSLWWSDMHGHQVNSLLDGRVINVIDVPNRPSGLGWLPDGRMLIVSMLDRCVLRLEADGTLVVHADLSALVPRRCNDMTVDRFGRAYVGNFGFDLDPAETPCSTVLVLVDVDGSARIVAEDLLFPNGAVITPQGDRLIISETWGAKLTVFDIAANGDLSNRRVWAGLDEGAVPDGICLDAEGAIWIASPTTHDCRRIQEGGRVLDRIPIGRGAFACMLGNVERNILYVCTADSHEPERQRRERNGRIEAFTVRVPGAGLP